MNKIILALDTSDLESAINIAKKVKDKIFTIKLGLEFFNAHGKSGIKKFNEMGIKNLMLDLKIKDIGETAYKAIKALDDIEFGFLTIHGQGGKEMIEKAKKAANEIKSKPKIMMVTILTALDDSDLKDMGNKVLVSYKVDNLVKAHVFCQKINKEIYANSREVWETKNTRAVEGLGPLLYDVCLEYISVEKNGALMPDRNTISKDAEAVWDKYTVVRLSLIHISEPTRRR